MTDAKERIRKARIVCAPPYTDIKYGQFPDSLILHLGDWARATGRHCSQRKPTKAELESHFLHALPRGAMDHIASAKYMGTSAFVTQPYGVAGAEVLACMALADEIGIRCVICAASHWNPGRTISLIFTPLL